MVERITGARRWAYALGMGGFQMSESVIVAIALYYYLPPPGRGLEVQLPAELHWGVFSAFGVAMLAGRIFDSVADPVVGHLSDRSRSRFGRRRVFMIAGVLPMTLLPVLVFWPPGPPGSMLNAVALACALSLYFIAFTLYVAPYLALIPELATEQEDRTRLSQSLGIVGIPVLILYGNAWGAGIDIGTDAGLRPEQSIRILVVGSMLVAFGLCLLPILSVDERRFARSPASNLSFRQAISATLSCRPFLIYMGGSLLMTLAGNLATPMPVYFATVVLGRSEGFTLNLALMVGLSTVVGLGVISRITDALGARRTLVVCNLVFATGMASLALLRPGPPGGPDDVWNLGLISAVFLTLGIPAVGFIVVPRVLISQVIDYDAARQHAVRAAMFFGIQGFFTKWVLGLGAAAISFLFLRFGNSPDEPLGVLLVGPLAALAALGSAGLYWLYPEDRVLRETRSTARG